MLDKFKDHSFISTALACSFIPVALSGVLLLFHISFPGMESIHEWIGLAFVAFSCFHMLLHWERLVKYLKNSNTHTALAFVLILTFVCGTIGALFDEGHGDRRHRQAISYRQ